MADLGKQVKFVILGTPELLKKFESLKGFSRSQRLFQVFEEAKNTIIPLARREVPRRSYVLHNSIGGRVERDRGGWNPRIIIDARAKYARWVEEGTRGGYEIRPKTKRWLRWANNGNNSKVITAPGINPPPGLTEIFRKSVIHPGIKAHPFLAPAIERVRPRLMLAISNLLDETMKGQ